MTDALLYQTNDDGEINVFNGDVELSDSLETAVYLSLFGGNENDAGRSNTEFQWWGNINETDQDKKYRSQTQYILRGTPAIPANLKRIEDAILIDLQWVVSDGLADEVIVSTTMPRLNTVQATININSISFTFTENWQVVV